MQKRKLQIFLSSTYEDLIDERLAAMEAILAAGHIPAAMEQFSPGDETAWEKITSWIDESDAFILILGGRYGSIEPTSGKGYVQLEYEYAIEKKKPLFALVISREHHEERVKTRGLRVHEQEHTDKYKQFYGIVTERPSRFWNDRKDIQAAIFQKLPEWAQRSDLTGWIRADQAPGAEVTNELARLSHENRELRARLQEKAANFDGFSFEELVKTLREHELQPDASNLIKHVYPSTPILVESIDRGVVRHLGVLTDVLIDALSLAGEIKVHNGFPDTTRLFNRITSFGLFEATPRGDFTFYALSETGRRFRAHLWRSGSKEQRLNQIWNIDYEHSAKGS